MLLNTDNAFTDFLIVLDLTWTVIGPNDEGLNNNKLCKWTVNFSVFGF